MRQHPIDLLPDALRARSQAGMRARRYAAAFAGAVILVVVLSLHSRWALSSVNARLKVTEDQANLVLRCEAKAAELRQALEKLHRFVLTYDRVALPIPTSRLLATISNQMPDSITLERLDVITQSHQASKSPRSKGTAPSRTTANAGSSGDSADSSPPRLLMIELAGFAAAEQDIAEFVGGLESTPPFEDVSLNYIRTRKAGDSSVHEFCLGFRINLDQRFEVVDLDPSDSSEVAHAGQ